MYSPVRDAFDPEHCSNHSSCLLVSGTSVRSADGFPDTSAVESTLLVCHEWLHDAPSAPRAPYNHYTAWRALIDLLVAIIEWAAPPMVSVTHAAVFSRIWSVAWNCRVFRLVVIEPLAPSVTVELFVHTYRFATLFLISVTFRRWS